MPNNKNEFPNRLYIQLGKRIREVRDAKGLTQDGLAKASYLSRTSITNIEKGRQHIPLHTLYVISTALDVKVADLLPDPTSFRDDMVPERILEDVPEDVLEWIQKIASDTKIDSKKR